jgi:DNA polymerase III sliding clamp (beta) subunit (PCNA family)
VDLKRIVPTQKMVTIPNIESTKEVELYPILFKLNDRYYVLDGHHRITNAILKGEKEVMSYVYDYKAQNSDKFNNGGQLDLVDESKKGDHPSRDLNNYNDLMDVEADGQVGMENGLAFDEGGFMADVYAGGGQTLSAEVFEWDKVPTNYRNISKVKKVPFTNNPMDKGLDSIIAPFLGKDELRPVGMGINFDKNGITATDFHKLITLPYPNEKYEGIYDVNRVKKIKADQPILIDGNYPNYEAIIPKSNIISGYEVDVYKLLQYTKTAINYANKTTKGISFKFGDNERIGFNGSLLLEVLTASLKLGHEKLYAKITAPNRAMVLSPKKDYELGSDEILLIMPIMLTSTFGTITGYGAEDVDYNRSIKAYFDFNDSEIHNADGSVAEFKMQYENNLSVDDKYLALLSKITSKNNKLVILDYAKVEDGKMTATDLDISLIIKDVNMPNGIYEIVNKAPNITMQPIEDFPSERVFNKDEYETHWKTDKRFTAFEFVTFSEVFEFYLDKLLLSVGKDDLRPVMSGICIKKTAQNEMFLVTTNAHTLCKINITEYCEFNKDDRELEYILPVKYLNDFVKLADGSLHFKCSLSNIFIEAENLDFIGKTIDGKYPNYEAVIPKQNDKMIVFDHAQMNKCLKSPEVANQVAKYKGNKDVFFTLSNEGNNLFLKVTKEIRFNVEYQLVDKIKLCEIEFNYEQVDTNIGLDKSVFLLMPSKDEFKENQYFSFRKDFFDVMLETITDTEVECYFTEPNRAYIFPIDAIDYKKTLPEEKTKQQPKKVAKAKKEAVNVEREQVREAIETLLMLAEIEENEEQRKEIYEALEILNMLKEDSYEYGGALGKKLTFEPIRTPLN